MARKEELSVGQTLYDNDPRRPGRKVIIVEVGNSYVRYRPEHRIPGRRGHENVLLSSIFTDGVPRRMGYSTTPPATSGEPAKPARNHHKREAVT